MKLSPEDVHIIILTLEQQAVKNEALIGPGQSGHADLLRKVARAIRKGERLEVDR